MSSPNRPAHLAPSGLSLFLLFLVLFLTPPTALGLTEEEDTTKMIRIVGSGYTMPLFLNPWARAFEEKTGTIVKIVPTGTSTAPPALLSGEAEIAAMTRPLNDAEARVLEENFGTQAIQLPVAEDEVAVFVHQDNPLSRLTLKQLDAIYSKDRRCGGPTDLTRWGPLGVVGELASRRISLFGRRTGSGTGSFFRTRALCGGEFKDWVRISPGRESAAIGVRESKFGIGFGSLRDQKPGMKVVSLAANDGGPFVVPGATDAIAYPLARTLNFVIVVSPQSSPADHVLEFLEFIYERNSQKEVERAGFRALGDLLRSTSLARIRSIVAN